MSGFCHGSRQSHWPRPYTLYLWCRAAPTIIQVKARVSFPSGEAGEG